MSASPEPKVTEPPPSALGLPPAPRRFVGRDELLDGLCAKLLQSPAPAVALLGPGGIGKSTLTLRALHRRDVSAHFGARRWFVRLDTATTADAALTLIAEALGLRPQSPLLPAVRAFLEPAPGVLALDNLETPWEGDLEGTEALLQSLRAVPDLAVMISLRGVQRPDGIDAEAMHVPQLDEAAAAKLFCDISRAKSDDPSLPLLIAQLDGVPLAITLLARAAEGDSLANLLAEWKQKRTVLLAREGAKPGRETNWAASMALSVRSRRMTDEARRLLALLGRLPDGVARDDLNRLLPGRGREAGRKLVQVSLAYDDRDRLRVLAPVREYAHAELTPTPDDLTAARDHYASLAATFGPRAGREGGAEAIARLTPETANLDVMLREGLAGDKPEPWIDAAVALTNFARFSGHSSPSPLQAALEAAKRVDDTGRQARCLFWLGAMALDRAAHGEARQRFEEALPLHRRVGLVLGEANCIFGFGDLALERSEHDKARRRYGEALLLFRQVGSVQGEANCIKGFGAIALERSEHDEASRLYGEALLLFRQMGDVLGEANCIKGFGDVALHHSDWANAKKHYQTALSLFTRLPEPHSMAVVHCALARLATDGVERRGHVATARELRAKINRPDLLAKLDAEFAPLPPTADAESGDTSARSTRSAERALEGAQARQLSAPTRQAESATAPVASGEKARAFISYAARDAGYLAELEQHLVQLKQSAAIDVWHRGLALAGALVEGEVAERLEKADLVLLLVSSDFLSSEECSSEMSRALEKRADGSERGAVVVPILLRPVAGLKEHPIGGLQRLPRDGRAVSQWPDRDEAWVDVVEGLRALLKKLAAGG